MLTYPDGSSDTKGSKPLPQATPEQIKWTNQFKKLERRAIKAGKDIPWNQLSEQTTKILGYSSNYMIETGEPDMIKFKLRKAGKTAALQKLGIGMELSFDDPAAAYRHQERRNLLGNVTGLVGSVLGGTAGGTLGAAAGGATPIPGGAAVGLLGGGIAGAELGGQMASLPATALYDIGHDFMQRNREISRGTQARLNTSAGFPQGM